MSPVLHITGDPAADELLSTDPLALLIGMQLDQQQAMEAAFAGPLRLRDRIGGLDAATIANYDAEALVTAFRERPVIHRFPGSMAARVQSLCAAIASEYGGDASAIWTRDNPDGTEIKRRLMALPGFGEQKAKIFLALLGKQYGVDAAGLARGRRRLRRRRARTGRWLTSRAPRRSPRCASSSEP